MRRQEYTTVIRIAGRLKSLNPVLYQKSVGNKAMHRIKTITDFIANASLNKERKSSIADITEECSGKKEKLRPLINI